MLLYILDLHLWRWHGDDIRTWESDAQERMRVNGRGRRGEAWSESRGNPAPHGRAQPGLQTEEILHRTLRNHQHKTPRLVDQ